MDFALNNLQRLICHETQKNNQPYADSIYPNFSQCIKSDD